MAVCTSHLSLMENSITDELHMMLRITDSLLDNLIQEIKDLDNLEKMRAGRWFES